MNGLKPEKKRIYGYHVLFWLLYSVYFYGINKLDNNNFSAYWLVVYVPGFLLIFYSVYGILWANFAQRFTWRGIAYLALFYFIFALLAAVVTFRALLGTSLDLTIEAWKEHSFSGFLQTLIVLLSNYSVFAVAYFWMRRSIANAQAKQMEAEQKAHALQQLLDSELEKQQLEYQSLSQQVSPHFLANLVSSWQGQLGTAHERLAASMEKMHALMVYHMEAKEQEHVVVPLRREVGFLRVYAELIRQPARPLYVEWEVTQGITGYNIPPTALITLLENACKHGVTNDPATPVRVCLTLERKVMRFSCRNRIGEEPNGESHGVGLANLRRRLQIKYDQHASLQTFREGNDFVAQLTIAY